MLQTLKESFSTGFNWSNDTWWFQFFGVIGIAYFLLKSVWKLLMALVERKHEKGVFPALGFVYMMLSAWFVLIMVGSFDEITKTVLTCFERSYILVNSTDFSLVGYPNNRNNYLNPTQVDDLNYIKSYLNTSLLYLLIAFSFNFSKSFFTLNSLELGLLPSGYKQKENIREILKGWGFYFECIIRVFVAFAFILIEKEFSEISKNFSEEIAFTTKTIAETPIEGLKKSLEYIKTIFNHLAISILGLYLGILIWSIPFLFRLKPKWHLWKIATLIQAVLGLLLAYFYYQISLLDISNFSHWTREFSFNAKVMLWISRFLILTIIVAEIYPLIYSGKKK